MLAGSFSAERFSTDKTLAQAVTKHEKNLADHVGVDRTSVALGFFVSSHVKRQSLITGLCLSLPFSVAPVADNFLFNLSMLLFHRTA